jgi:hypothetical protein
LTNPANSGSHRFNADAPASSHSPPAHRSAGFVFPGYSAGRPLLSQAPALSQTHRTENSETTVNLKPFPKGVSGNPGGRPKGIAAKAREHTDKALDVLVEGMADEDPRVRVAAAKEVLDRGWGKSLTMTADVTKRLDDFTDDDIDAGIAFLRAALGASAEAGDREGPKTKH